MPPNFSPIVGAQGFQQSNPCILALASLLGSLQIFKDAGMMGAIRERSIRLTGALERLLMTSKYFVPLSSVSQKYPGSSTDTAEPGFTIITPDDPSLRGAQLSLLFLPISSGVMERIFSALCSYGVIGDEREPDVIRLAPIPLYNTIKDCEQGVFYLEKAFESIHPK
jgi:kynureninase